MESRPESFKNPEDDRRRAPRWDICLPCRVRWGKREFDAEALDLSATGAFIESPQVLPEGAKIEVRFLVGGVEQSVSSAVVHSGRYQDEIKNILGFGVVFQDPPAETLSLLQHLHHWRLPESESTGRRRIRLNPERLLSRLLAVNKEIWLVVSLILVSGLINLIVDSNQMVLGFYTLPTLFSAYFFGRKHATLTALASVLLVVLVSLDPFSLGLGPSSAPASWLEIVVWAGTLIITGYAMGTLYEHMRENLQELRETYNGVLLILQHLISNDKYTANHSYRVSIYATRIAAQMRLGDNRIEDIRAAALLHDIGKLDVSRSILYKASRLSDVEFEEMKRHVERGVSMLEPVGGSLKRVLPIILAHHDHYDGSGYRPTMGKAIPLGARIIAVADAFDAMTSDRPYRKAIPGLAAKEIIEERAGKDFDPEVVEAFLAAYRRGEMEVPEIVV